MSQDSNSAVEILLVEDNAGDVRLVQEAVRQFESRCILNVARDGVEALEYVRGEGQYKDRALPDMIILDLKLPKKSGHEVLAEIKEDSDLRRIPVVVLSTSGERRELQQSYDLHANCYITKPVDLDGFVQAVRSIEGFWLSVVRLPEK